MTTFARFPPRLQQAVVARLGWTSLRPVQDLAGDAILDGKNVVVLAPTAGGKTEAAMFPVLAGLVERPVESVGAIYIAPIKALLNNQEDRLGTYAEMVGLRRFVWHGDVGDPDKRRFIKEPGELLMTTPESLEVMLISPRAPVDRLFADLRFVIIDEVHALAGTDRGAHMLSVLERVARSTKNDVQRIGLSATVGNPVAILEWLQGSSKREREVIIAPKVAGKRQVEIVRRASVLEIAREAAKKAAGKKSLFFCQSRALTETVAEEMRAGGTDVFVHHSSVSAEERREAEASFHHGTNVAIACTSTLELGIDVGDLDQVFQANAPSSVSSFMQRMGRTGRRAGTVANTTFFCESSDAVLQAVALVELARSEWVESIPPQTRCWPVLVHQLFAMALQFGGVSAERCWEQLARVPDFRGIERSEYDALIQHLVREQYLWESGGLLSLGGRAEKIYGRKNFSELYAVFSSPVLYTVKTAANRSVAELVLDGVLAMEVDGNYVSGAAAYHSVFEEMPEPEFASFISRLSIRALQYGESLRLDDAVKLAMRLYLYNSMPYSASWESEFPSLAAIETALGLEAGGRNDARISGCWERVDTRADAQGWMAWRARGHRSESRRIPVGYKLYLSPRPEHVREAVDALCAAVCEPAASHANCRGAHHFKIGSSAAGLLRADKIVAYFNDWASLECAADRVYRELRDCPAQGVPFTADLAGDGLLSWGIDPPSDQFRLKWQQKESWRLWVTNRLALALTNAQREASTVEPWRFAMGALKLEGVNTDTWTTYDTTWIEAEREDNSDARNAGTARRLENRAAFGVA